MQYIIRHSDRAQDAINRFKKNIGNFEEVGPEVHRAMKRQAKKTFDTDGANIGTKWPGYTGGERIYGIIKKVLLGKKDGKRLLRWKPGRERLFPSVVSARHPEHVWRVEGSTFMFGTKVPYAYNHQYGKGRGPLWAGRARVKQRKFIGMSDKTAAEIRRIMINHVGI